jgi:hypothetical protein
MKTILAIAFTTGTLLDLFISFIGFTIMLNADTAFTYAISFAASFASVCIRLCWERIFQHPGVIYFLLKGAFVLSLLLDFYVSMTALAAHALFNNPLWYSVVVDWNKVFTQEFFVKKIILLLIGIGVVLSPVIMSKIARQVAEKQ